VGAPFFASHSHSQNTLIPTGIDGISPARLESEAMRRLDELTPGEEARIQAVRAPARLLRRLFALGIRPGSRVRLLRRAPLGDPLEVRVGESLVALRRREARGVVLEDEG